MVRFPIRVQGVLDVVEWWKIHKPDIPNWAEVCMQTNLACAIQLSGSRESFLIIPKRIQ